MFSKGKDKVVPVHN